MAECRKFLYPLHDDTMVLNANLKKYTAEKDL